MPAQQQQQQQQQQFDPIQAAISKIMQIFGSQQSELPEFATGGDEMSEFKQQGGPPPQTAQSIIEQGLADYAGGRQNPMGEFAPQLAQAGAELPHQFLPAALAIKESSALVPNGGNQAMIAANNPFGIKPPGGLAEYPDIETAILGGGTGGPGGAPQKGFLGTMKGGAYDDYLESGDLEDFLSTYTPESDDRNESIRNQLEELKSYLDYFLKHLKPSATVKKSEPSARVKE